MTEPKVRSPIGTGWAFPPAFKHAGFATAMTTGYEDIEQSLTILLGTTPGERPMRPEYGCNLKPYVFEVVDNTLCNTMVHLIRQAIDRFEARIEVEDITFRYDSLEGFLEFTIPYRLRHDGSRNTFIYPFYLEPAGAAP